MTALAVLPGAADAAAATERVSASGSGGQGNGENNDAAISADGLYVVFASRSTNIHPDDTDTVADVYVRDRRSNTTILVSRAGGAGDASF